MLPKIIRKGEQQNNVNEKYQYQTIPWDELIKNKEARTKQLLEELTLKEIEKEPSKRNKKEIKKTVEITQPVITPSIDLDFIKKEAEKILNNANTRKDEIEKQAYEQGYSSGKTIGIEEGKREYTEAFAKLEESISQIISIKEQLIREYEPEIIKLAITISEKILKREIKISSDHIVEIVSSLVKQLKDKSKVIIKLSPDDYKDLKNSPRLGELKYISTNFEITEDITLSKGGVMVDTAFGTIDGSIETQLEKIKEELV